MDRQFRVTRRAEEFRRWVYIVAVEVDEAAKRPKRAEEDPLPTPQAKKETAHPKKRPESDLPGRRGRRMPKLRNL